jgi:predicted glycoside hydrolase/deacetylase ChbG (UPF0249 family)
MFKKNNSTIIISADDFGISKLANENILQLVRNGKIDRVEIMMSQNITAKHAAELLASGVKLDIHLHLATDNLDLWQSSSRKLKSGTFKRVFIFLGNYFFGKNRPREIAKEWKNQIQEFRHVFQKSPDGISSHEHIHFFPSYFPLALKLAKDNNISYVRFGKHWIKEKNPICFILNFLEKIDGLIFNKSEFESADLLVSFDWINNFNEFLKNCPDNKKIELVFHPEKANEFEFLNKLTEKKLSL